MNTLSGMKHTLVKHCRKKKSESHRNSSTQNIEITKIKHKIKNNEKETMSYDTRVLTYMKFSEWGWVKKYVRK